MTLCSRLVNTCSITVVPTLVSVPLISLLGLRVGVRRYFEYYRKLVNSVSRSGPLAAPSLPFQAHHLSLSSESDALVSLRPETIPDPPTRPCICPDEAFSNICPHLRAHLLSPSMQPSQVAACTCPDEYRLMYASRTCPSVADHLHVMVSHSVHSYFTRLIDAVS